MTTMVLVRPDGASHRAMPADGTWVCAATGQPADLRCESGYPVTATCQVCGRRIRLRAMGQADWEHDALPPALAGGVS